MRTLFLALLVAAPAALVSAKETCDWGTTNAAPTDPLAPPAPPASNTCGSGGECPASSSSDYRTARGMSASVRASWACSYGNVQWEHAAGGTPYWMSASCGSRCVSGDAGATWAYADPDYRDLAVRAEVRLP